MVLLLCTRNTRFRSLVNNLYLFLLLYTQMYADYLGILLPSYIDWLDGVFIFWN